MVREYLAAVRGGGEDHGWSLLLADAQTTTFQNDVSAYIERARAAEWDTFGWDSRRVVRDEPFTDRVSLKLTAGSEMPSLVAMVTDFETSPFPPGPTFVVRFHPAFGGVGIWSRNGVDERAEASPQD